ncbi:DUF262 domain-containing protein [Roseomonas sp. CCTCC AB2023176]|uniref:DUF262 domain-containing protein n=1 Tax=Roseomonas sp. CCTCC AB2023176 TaxID=3342640 RepID=UPI0035D5694D
MDSSLQTLSKIFSERLFRIPDYQRGYAWTEKQVRDFWNDIEQLSPDTSHYTGVLTLENVPASEYARWDNDLWIIAAKNYQPFFVVDGQQRLTTAVLLIQVILESLPDDGKLNFTDKADIKRKFIVDSKDGFISRSYVFGYQANNPSYIHLRAKIFNENVADQAEDTVYTQNLDRAKAFFREKVSALGKDALEILYRKITQSLLFNVFTISSEVDVCVAFETMNNRGKPLSYLELLKNRLIYLTLKLQDTVHEQVRLREVINDCWRAIYHNLGRNRERTSDDDRLLTTHYVVYFGASVPEPELVARTYYLRSGRNQSSPAADLLEQTFITRNIGPDVKPEKRITTLFIHDYAQSLQEAAKTWFGLYSPLRSDFDTTSQIWLDKLTRLNADDFVPLLLVTMQLSVSDLKKVQLLKAVERHLFVMMLSPNRYYLPPPYIRGSYEPALLAIRLKAGDITLDKVVQEVVRSTDQLLNDPDLMRSVFAKFRSDGWYEWPGLRYFLFEYNLDAQRRSKTERTKLHWPEFNGKREDFMTVEHIYPRSARHPYWQSQFDGFTTQQRKALRESLGNLLPLSRGKNASLSNRPFPEKAHGETDTYVSYTYGCYAENEVSRKKDWSPAEITERGLKLIGYLERRWQIHLGDDNAKLDILGIPFMAST